MFLAAFPEFRDTDPTLIAAKLAQAAARMGGPDPGVWGGSSPDATGASMTLADSAQGYLAAHLLKTSPMGTQLRQSGEGKGDGKTGYLRCFEDLLETAVAMSGSFVVAGGGPW